MTAPAWHWVAVSFMSLFALLFLANGRHHALVRMMWLGCASVFAVDLWLVVVDGAPSAAELAIVVLSWSVLPPAFFLIEFWFCRMPREWTGPDEQTCFDSAVAERSPASFDAFKLRQGRRLEAWAALGTLWLLLCIFSAAQADLAWPAPRLNTRIPLAYAHWALLAASSAAAFTYPVDRARLGWLLPLAWVLAIGLVVVDAAWLLGVQTPRPGVVECATVLAPWILVPMAFFWWEHSHVSPALSPMGARNFERAQMLAKVFWGGVSASLIFVAGLALSR